MYYECPGTITRHHQAERRRLQWRCPAEPLRLRGQRGQNYGGFNDSARRNQDDQRRRRYRAYSDVRLVAALFPTGHSDRGERCLRFSVHGQDTLGQLSALFVDTRREAPSEPTRQIGDCAIGGYGNASMGLRTCGGHRSCTYLGSRMQILGIHLLRGCNTHSAQNGLEMAGMVASGY